MNDHSVFKLDDIILLQNTVNTTEKNCTNKGRTSAGQEVICCLLKRQLFMYFSSLQNIICISI